MLSNIYTVCLKVLDPTGLAHSLEEFLFGLLIKYFIRNEIESGGWGKQAKSSSQYFEAVTF